MTNMRKHELATRQERAAGAYAGARDEDCRWLDYARAELQEHAAYQSSMERLLRGVP